MKKIITLASIVSICIIGTATSSYAENNDTDTVSKTETAKTSTPAEQKDTPDTNAEKIDAKDTVDNTVKNNDTIIKTEKIPFETRIVEDPQLPQNTNVTVSEGKDGTKTFYQSKELVNTQGEIQEIPVNYDSITVLPEEKVIRQGTKTETINVVSDKTIQLEQEKKVNESAQKAADDKKKQEETKKQQDEADKKKAAETVSTEQTATNATDNKAPNDKAASTLSQTDNYVSTGDVTTCQSSFYWQGQMTASGEQFNPNDMTAAHKTLPLGTKIRVTNPANSKSVVVRINDRGPYIGGRCLDLSKAAFANIGNTDSGVMTVQYEIVK